VPISIDDRPFLENVPRMGSTKTSLDYHHG